MKKILWVRELSCGHERPTNIAFLCKKYEKPLVGGECFCRDCCVNVKIIGVKESDYDDEELMKNLSAFEKIFDKRPSKKNSKKENRKHPYKKVRKEVEK